MTYTITLESFNGSTKKINLASRGAVAQFISQYPAQLPVGVSVKVSCDVLGVRGTLRGKATL
jgi:ribose 1,5-bisphosphokinase PhnN